MAVPGARVSDRDAFVGRAGLLADLIEPISAGRSILLVGPAGVGKSRLAAELLKALPDRASETFLAGPGTARHRFGLFAATGALDGIGPADPDVLFDRYLRRWRVSGERNEQPVILYIDDITHADDLSVALLRQAVAAGFAQILATSRSGKTVPAEILSLAVDDHLDVVEVPALTDEDAAELTRKVGPDDIADDEVERIVGVAGGYPLFLRALSREGSATRSPTLAAVLDARLASLSPRERAVAEMLAAADTADWRLFESERTVVSDLLRDGFVVWADSEHLRLEHPLYAELLLERLGRMAEDTYGELVERASSLDIDALVLADWMLQSGTEPDPSVALRAARLAIERADPVVAARLAPFTDEWAGLIAAQAMLLDGRDEDGIRLLENVRVSAGASLVRAEAASAAARHLGLTRGDFTGGHEILSDTEASVPDEARRILLLARLWLWIFGDLTPEADVSLVDQLDPQPGEPHWLSLEIIVGASAVLHQISGTTLIRHGHAALLAAEQRVHSDGFLWARIRAVEAGFYMHSGDVRGGVRMLEAALDDERGGSPTATRLIAANICFYAATVGRLSLATRAAARAYELRDVEDTFRMGEQVRLLHDGVFLLSGAGPDPSDWPMAVTPSEEMQSIELMATIRTTCLREVGADLTAPVETLIRGRSLGLLAMLYADCIDDSNRGVHAAVATAFGRVESTGLWAMVELAARARAERDAGSLARAADAYARAGFIAGATRAGADVLRMTDIDDTTRYEARRIVCRALRSWEGDRPPWVEHVGLPSPRELEAAWLAVDGASVSDIAARWSISRRTVENHLFRACKGLGVSGIEGLRDALADVEYARAEI